MKFRFLATNVGFTEGPVFRQAGDVVVTSIDRGHLYRIEEGKSAILAVTGGGPNGSTEGPDGSIYVTQNGGRGPGWSKPAMTGGIQAVQPDGHVVWITKDLVTPNDLCFGPDGYLYATDPTRRPQRDDGRLWRINVQTGDAELLVSLNWYPNGIGFGLEDDAVYVASTGDSTIRRFPFSASGLGKPETYVTMETCHPDGFAFDVEGNLVIAGVGTGEGPGNIQTYDRNGRLLDVQKPGDSHYYTNLAISEDRRLIVTDSSSGGVLIADGWPHAGLPLHPFRRPG
jgi:gluconolactonase